MRIKLWNETPGYCPEYGQPEPSLEVYPVDAPKGCFVVCPGGGYEGFSYNSEGLDVAAYLNQQGYYVYILNYRLRPYHHPAQQSDVNRAIRLARFRADECGYDPHRIAVIGFSAGGHLAMTACTFFDDGIDGTDEIDKISCRPDAGVLCYGVLTLGTPYTDWGTTRNLLGEDYDPKLAESLSAAGAVRPDMPPCFIWHTAQDSVVPVQNALVFAEAIHSVGVPYELHIFPFGYHGLAVDFNANPHVGRWVELLEEFLGLYWK